MTVLSPTRTSAARESISRGFLLALLLHAAAIGGVMGWAYVHFATRHNWGDQNPVAGSIQATMVNALPLPPRQFTKEDAVLTSDKPNIAPTPPPPEPAKPKSAPTPPKAEPAPKPNDIPIPTKARPTPTPKEADRSQPEPTRRPATPPAPTPKATTGETAGVRIPESTTELKNGTATITVEEKAFGDRYAYYIRLISQKVNQARAQQDPDPPDARGRRTAILFTIGRDGTVQDAEVLTRSGSPALDNSALRCIQRIDTFGPLPAGDHLVVTFGFTDK